MAMFFFYQNDYVQCVEFMSLYSKATWILANVYAPCTDEGKQLFLNWFYNFDMDNENDWLWVGDFNLIRRPPDRNKPGGNVQFMLAFNVAISNLGLEEIALQGNGILGQINRNIPC